MRQRTFRHSTFVGSLLLDALCSCVTDHDAGASDGAIGGGPQSEASATQDATRPEAFESVGGLSCQSSAPSEFITAPPCSDEPVACDASLMDKVEQLLESCSYHLNENSLEVFVRDGCAVGIVEGREDRFISDEARQCVRAGVGRMHADCLRALCIRVERSTLAAL